VKAAGIEENTHFHDLRHMGASVLLEAGVPDQVVAALTGHRGRTLKRYQQLSNEFRRQTTEKLAGILLGEKSSDTFIAHEDSDIGRASRKGRVKSHRTKSLDGRPVWTRTPDLYRVNPQLIDL